MDVRVLGPLEVRDADGNPVGLGPPKQRAVLALLAIDPGRVVSADRVADELWPGGPPRTAANTIQAYVSRLRSALGRGAIATRAPGYTLELDPEDIDATRFRRLASLARDHLDAGDVVTASDLAGQATALWRGSPYADITGIVACEAEAERLRDVHLELQEVRLGAQIDLDRAADAATELAALIVDHPLRESLYGLRMVALYRAGRQADALQCYAGLRRVLDDELGVTPTPELQRLELAILEQRAELSAWHRPGATTAVLPPAVVPEPVTSYVERAEVLADVLSAVETNRLVTLSGAGGSGKTRLAIEVARRRDHAWFVALASVDSPLVMQHIARTLGIDERSSDTPQSAVVARLGGGDGLLVLDNCEHVLDAAADATRALLGACPRLRILATSREPLRGPGEAVYRVSLLPVPAADAAAPLDAAASRLFVDRALAVVPHFDSERHAGAIGQIVRRLDGIPLAIELAAARLDVLSPSEIADRLSDALGLLSGSARTDEPHHRTLRATLAWTYDTLSPDQRSLFRRLSAFVGGFVIAHAEALVGSSALDDLSRLVALSLIERDDSGPSMRFGMLETTRQFADEQLRSAGDTVDVRRRHAQIVTDAVHGSFGLLATQQHATGWEVIDAEIGNIRAALAFLVDEARDADGAIRLAEPLIRYWQTRGHLAEGRRSLEAVVELAGDSEALLPIRLGIGGICQLQGDLDAAQGHYEAALSGGRRASNSTLTARSLNNLGNIAVLRQQLEVGRELFTQAVDAARVASDVELSRLALNNLAQVVRRTGEASGGRTLYLEALEGARALGDPILESVILLNVGEIDRMAGDLSSAREHLEAAMSQARRAGHAAAIPAVLGALGNLARAEGLLDEAARYMRQSVDEASSFGNPVLVAAGVANLAGIAQESGDLDEARTQFQRYREMSDDLGDRRGGVIARRGLAEVMASAGDFERAARLLATALRDAVELGQPEEVAACLETASTLAASSGASFDHPVPALAWLADVGATVSSR